MYQRIVAIVILILACGTAGAEPPTALRVIALWRKGDGSKQVIIEQLTPSKFVSLGPGIGLTSIAAYEFEGASTVIAVAEPVSHADTGHMIGPVDWANFASLGATANQSGRRLVDIAISGDTNDFRKVLYTGYWRKGLGNAAQFATMAVPWDQFQENGAKRFAAGQRLVSMSAVAVLDNVQQGTFKPLFTAVWNGSSSGSLFLIAPTDHTTYSAKTASYRQSGLGSIAMSAYTLDGSTPIYTGAVGAKVPPAIERASQPLTWSEFLALHALQVKRGYRLADIAVYTIFFKFD